MASNQDFKDLFVALNAHGVEFPVAGAHALAAHGCVRATKDLDVRIRPDRENAVRVMRALETFGAPTQAVSEDDFAEPGITFQIGVEPVRIDMITAVDGLTFESAWQNRVSSDYGGAPVFVVLARVQVNAARSSGRDPLGGSKDA